LAEQAIHCLELVAELAELGLSFQFKGGNSLLLILGKPKRFSIDVDVASDRPREEIEFALERAVKKYGVFTKWERRQHKTKPWLPMTSYYLYYNSVIEPRPDTNIMFDVQMRRSAYRTELKMVTSGDLYQSGVMAVLPLPSSIISDKLLTLGPNTLGIPVGRGKGAQRLKHVYDVSRLSATMPDIELIRESFEQCLQQENELQGSNYTVMEIVKDTLQFLFTTALCDVPPESAENPALEESVSGIGPFAGHLFEADYGWQSLRRDMARAAACITAAGNRNVTDRAFHSFLKATEVPSGFEGTLGIGSQLPAYFWETVYEWWNKDAFWVTL
jgi:hypothetical protein